MSNKGIGEFVKDATQNESLSQEVIDAVSGKPEDEGFAIVVEIAAKHGYAVTAADVRGAWAALQEKMSEDAGGELSEEDLDAVAGGTSTSYSSSYWNYRLQKAASDVSGTSSGSSSSSGCFLSTACTAAMGLPDDCEELTTLRDFRDNWIRRQSGGESVIGEYYEHAPGIVDAINRRSNAADIYSDIYCNLVRPCVEMIEQDRPQDCFQHYRKYFLATKKEFTGADRSAKLLS